jgi:hypothetical protein
MDGNREKLENIIERKAFVASASNVRLCEAAYMCVCMYVCLYVCTAKLYVSLHCSWSRGARWRSG